MPSRSWIKVYVNEWMNGTMRFQMTTEQRALWVDLLVLAGESRYPNLGVIAPGETNGKLDAYPLSWIAGRCLVTEAFLKDTLVVLEQQDRIRNADGVIYIKNWAKYQSEYVRQLPSRLAAKKRRAGQSASQSVTSAAPGVREIRVEQIRSDREKISPLPSPEGGSAPSLSGAVPEVVVLENPPDNPIPDMSLPEELP
jgi:hypothetical protein